MFLSNSLSVSSSFLSLSLFSISLSLSLSCRSLSLSLRLSHSLLLSPAFFHCPQNLTAPFISEEERIRSLRRICKFSAVMAVFWRFLALAESNVATISIRLLVTTHGGIAELAIGLYALGHSHVCSLITALSTIYFRFQGLFFCLLLTIRFACWFH